MLTWADLVSVPENSFLQELLLFPLSQTHASRQTTNRRQQRKGGRSNAANSSNPTFRPWEGARCSGAVLSTKPGAKHVGETQEMLPEQKDVSSLTALRKRYRTHPPPESASLTQGKGRFHISIRQRGKLRHRPPQRVAPSPSIPSAPGAGQSLSLRAWHTLSVGPAHAPSAGAALWSCHAALKNLLTPLTRRLLFPFRGAASLQIAA